MTAILRTAFLVGVVLMTTSVRAQEGGGGEAATIVSGQPLVFRMTGAQGEARVFEYRIERDCRLYVHAVAKELDLVIEALDAEGRVIAADDDSGGAKSPYLDLSCPVAAGTVRRFRVRSKSALAGTGELRLFDSTSGPSLLSAAEDAREDIEEIRELLRAGERDEASELAAELAEELLETDGARDNAEVLNVLWTLGNLLRRLGDARAQTRLQRLSVRFSDRALPLTSKRALDLRATFANSLRRVGDLEECRDLLEETIAHNEPHRDRHDVALENMRMTLGATLYQLGRVKEAAGLFERVLEARLFHHPENHPRVAMVRANLAGCLGATGDWERAHEELEKVAEIFREARGPEHPVRLTAELNLGVALLHLDRVDGARELLETVLSVYIRTLPPEDMKLARVRGALGEAYRSLGRPGPAVALLEMALASRREILPAGHRDLEETRVNLGNALFDLGDDERAVVMLGKALENLSRAVPDDDHALQALRLNYSSILIHRGDLEAARTLLERAMASCEKTQAGSSLEFQRVALVLAETMGRSGDMAGREAREREILRTLVDEVEDDHPLLQTVRVRLAGSLVSRGEYVEARELLRTALSALDGKVSQDNGLVSDARNRLARVSRLLGFEKEEGALVSDILASTSARLASAERSLAPRWVEAMAISESPQASTVLDFAARSGSRSWVERAFVLVETMRSAAVGPRLLLKLRNESGDDDLRERRAEVARAAREISRVARSGGAPDALQAVVREKERAERALVTELARHPAAREVLASADVERISKSLAADEAAVGFWQYQRLRVEDLPRRSFSRENVLAAFVVTRDEPVQLVPLGSMDEILPAVRGWRRAVGAGIAAVSRGIEEEEEGADSIAERRAGERLRGLLIDPVIAKTGGASRIFVALWGKLHLVPLDALPVGEGGRIGERIELVSIPSLRRFRRRAIKSAGGSSVLAIGGVDYDAAARPGSVRSGGGPPAGDPLAPLPGTDAEAREVTESHGGDANVTLLRGAAATKAAFIEHAPASRFIHVATHAWFAPESVPSLTSAAPLDLGSGLGRSEDLRQRALGFSPLVLCGLALAGANGEGSQREAGILTGEEIATLDLRACELAVLSACETSLGRNRGGQGISSLQLALHAAGVQQTVTSLWAVSDEATRHIMTGFHHRVAVDGMPAARALWQAKMSYVATCEKAGRPVSTADWAGWVISDAR